VPSSDAVEEELGLGMGDRLNRNGGEGVIWSRGRAWRRSDGDCRTGGAESDSELEDELNEGSV